MWERRGSGHKYLCYTTLHSLHFVGCEAFIFITIIRLFDDRHDFGFYLLHLSLLATIIKMSQCQRAITLLMRYLPMRSALSGHDTLLRILYKSETSVPLLLMCETFDLHCTSLKLNGWAYSPPKVLSFFALAF